MDKQLQKYINYNLEDFLNDDLFKNWVKYPDQENEHYWQAVIASIPSKNEQIAEARSLILLLSHPHISPALERKDQIWLNIEKELQLRYSYPLRKKILFWTRLAAALFLCSLLGYTGYTYYQNTQQVFRTDYGKLRKLKLPDGSMVMLNSNSAVRYRRKWESGGPRELWMTGEALFDVQHLARKGKPVVTDTFRVHTGDLTVTVLGTAFNIRNRRNTTQITLSRGKIRLDFNEPGRAPVFLSPGEQAVYRQHSRQLQKVTADPEAVRAWSVRKLILKGDALEDVISVLEDNYGYRVMLRDPALARRKLTGTVPLHSAKDLIFIISKVFNVTTELHENTLIIY